MTIGCNIWMKLIWFSYGLSRIMQFSQFVWALSYSVWDVFNKFLLIDATDRSKISSDQKSFFIALSLYPLSFFANTPFKCYSLWATLYNFLSIHSLLNCNRALSNCKSKCFVILILNLKRVYLLDILLM